uniref:Anti-proliferative protein domain-containing protein n=1 Tax=Gasterosteus aculeatus aculeatus TaxID=481459 RepID=A0AAQ4QGG5_GASAC
MRREIAAVVFFLKRLMKKEAKLESHKIDLFVERLSKGQAYRCCWPFFPPNSIDVHVLCIRMNSFHKQDLEVLRACRESGVGSLLSTMKRDHHPSSTPPLQPHKCPPLQTALSEGTADQQTAMTISSPSFIPVNCFLCLFTDA